MEELKALRETPSLTVVEDAELPQGSHLWLGNRLLVNQAGKQSELRLSFARPATALVLGLTLWREHSVEVAKVDARRTNR